MNRLKADAALSEPVGFLEQADAASRPIFCGGKV